jgi:hypothetical protein
MGSDFFNASLQKIVMTIGAKDGTFKATRTAEISPV